MVMPTTVTLNDCDVITHQFEISITVSFAVTSVVTLKAWNETKGNQADQSPINQILSYEIAARSRLPWKDWIGASMIKRWQVTFFPLHRSYFCVCLTDGATLINSPSHVFSPRRSQLVVEDYSCTVREREHLPPLCQDMDLNPQSPDYEPSALPRMPQGNAHVG